MCLGNHQIVHQFMVLINNTLNAIENIYFYLGFESMWIYPVVPLFAMIIDIFRVVRALLKSDF